MSQRKYFKLIGGVGFITGVLFSTIICGYIIEKRKKPIFILLFIFSYGVKYYLRHKYKQYINQIDYVSIFYRIIEILKEDEATTKVVIYDKKVYIKYEYNDETKHLLVPYSNIQNFSTKVVYFVDGDESEIEVTQIPGIKYPSAKSIGGLCYRVVDTITNEERECDDPYEKN